MLSVVAVDIAPTAHNGAIVVSSGIIKLPYDVAGCIA